MAQEPVTASTANLIAGRFALDPARKLNEVGGGLTAFLALDRQAADAKRIAIAVSRDLPARYDTIRSLQFDPIDNLMTPLGHGIGPLPGSKAEGYYVVCTSPPGAPVLAELRPWTENALIEQVLRPVARVLDSLQGRGLTHRAIRPNNVFASGAGQGVTLGAAWAAPPAMHQPPVFESPRNALCHPSARGNGTIADDVYALGVLLITLSTGRIPMASMDEATIIRWKLDLGSYAALTRDAAVPSFIADLARGMLSDDPDHRPAPHLLLDPINARARRVAARPPRRSQRPLMLNEVAVFDSRTLALALLAEEKKAVQALTSGAVTHWLRRGLGDAGLAATIEDMVREREADTRAGPQSDALLLMQAISTIDPRMPLCWRGIALWPDGLGGLLAEGIVSAPRLAAIVEELVVNDVITRWVVNRTGSSTEILRAAVTDAQQQRQWLVQGLPGALLRLFYVWNPLMPCRVPAMQTAWVGSIGDLMRYFERSGALNPTASLIDEHIAAFIAARGDRKIEVRINSLLTGPADDAGVAELTLLRDLQLQFYQHPLPEVAKWMVQRLRPRLERWQNRPKRAAIAAQLEVLAQRGLLSRLLALVEDIGGRAADRALADRAAAELAVIEAELAAIRSSDRVRYREAERFGQEVTGAIGLGALILMVMLLMIG